MMPRTMAASLSRDLAGGCVAVAPCEAGTDVALPHAGQVSVAVAVAESTSIGCPQWIQKCFTGCSASARLRSEYSHPTKERLKRWFRLCHSAQIKKTQIHPASSKL